MRWHALVGRGRYRRLQCADLQPRPLGIGLNENRNDRPASTSNHRTAAPRSVRTLPAPTRSLLMAGPSSAGAIPSRRGKAGRCGCRRDRASPSSTLMARSLRLLGVQSFKPERVPFMGACARRAKPHRTQGRRCSTHQSAATHPDLDRGHLSRRARHAHRRLRPLPLHRSRRGDLPRQLRGQPADGARHDRRARNRGAATSSTSG